MKREHVLSILQRISIDDMTKTILSLKGGAAITLDTVARTEAEFLVVRGREAGTNDEGRGFFVPYEDIQFLKIDRMVKTEELKLMFGEVVAEKKTLESEARAEMDATAAADKKAQEVEVPTAPMDPAAIAKQNLLSRIRAARSLATNSPKQ